MYISLFASQDPHLHGMSVYYFGATDHNIDHESIMKLLNPYNIKNLFYICDPCTVGTIPQDEYGQKKSEINVEKQTNNNQTDEIPTFSQAKSSNIETNKSESDRHQQS